MSARLLVVALGLLAAGACNCGGGAGPCTDDAQCDATGQGFSKCNQDQGICICVDSRACGPNEFCNGAGRCQAEAGCETNDDCGDGGDSGLFCDITTSQCLSVQECNPQGGHVCCTLDDQCPFGQICNDVNRTCTDGCRDSGDCILGQGCAGAGFGRLGTCGTACTADNQCPFQDLCNLGTGLCELDSRGPYCRGCTGGANSDQCDQFGNLCLVDEFNPPAEFCGVECAQGQACPNGYSCQDVIIVLQTHQCVGPETCLLPAGACSRTGAACAVDEDCPQGPPGGDCPAKVGRVGSCAVDQSIDCANDADCPEGGCNVTQCAGSEGGQVGFCTCTKDSDCPADTCKEADVSDPAHPVRGHCELSGHPCFQDSECDFIACVEGGCLIGQNCAPANDRSCAQVQSSTSP